MTPKWFLESINKATNFLKIVSGWRCIFVYNSEEVIKALEAKLKEGVIIQIISGKNSDKCEKLEALAAKYPNNLFLYIYQYGDIPSKHFILTDDKFLIVEDPHEKNALGRKVTIVIPEVYRGLETIVNFKVWFDELLRQVHAPEIVSA